MSKQVNIINLCHRKHKPGTGSGDGRAGWEGRETRDSEMAAH